MKSLLKFAFLSVFLIASIGVFAQETAAEGTAKEGIQFFEGKWEDAVKKAHDENKYLMIDAYTDWCYWCKVMDKKTFANAEVGSFFQENVVAYKMDMEKGRGILMAMKYRVSSFPTFLFFSSEGALVSKVMGYQEPVKFLETMQNQVMNPEKQFEHPGDPANLEVAFPEFYKLSFKRGKERKMPTEDDVLSFLDQQEDLFGEISWAVMSRFGFPGRYREHFLTNMKAYRRFFGDEADEQVDRMVYGMVMDAAKAKSQDQLEEAINMGMQYSSAENPESMRMSYLMMYDQRTEDWKAYGTHVDEMMGMGLDLGNGQLNSYAWNVYLHVEDKELVKQAAGWMSTVIEEEPSYAYLDTYAAVLYKAGELKKAEKYAKKAIAIGKKEGEKVEETEALLKKIKE